MSKFAACAKCGHGLDITKMIIPPLLYNLCPTLYRTEQHDVCSGTSISFYIVRCA